MTTSILVQFESEQRTAVISYFGATQQSDEGEPDTYYPPIPDVPNAAVIDATDERYQVFYRSMPFFVQEGMVAPT